MPLFKHYAMIFKACSVSKESGDKAAAYLVNSTVTKKKFRNIVPTLFGIG
jgi:hypothetical protein